MIYNKIKSFPLHLRNMTLHIYEDDKFKTKHFHIEANSEQNWFLVNFNTPIDNNKGIPHIIEHSVLSGSKKFPSDIGFFDIAGKNMDFYTNAFTAQDETSYIFASSNNQGFFNLLDFYLDSVFHPLLKEKVFYKEGVRKIKNNDSIGISGIVYNEMIGAYNSNPYYSVIDTVNNCIYNDYRKYNAGGNPVDIIDLTYQEYIEFYKKYYNPSNATFFSFGTIKPEIIQEKIIHSIENLSVGEKIQCVKEDINLPNQKLYFTEYHGEGNFFHSLNYVKNELTQQEILDLKSFIFMLNSPSSNFTKDMQEKNYILNGVSFQNNGDYNSTIIYLDLEEDRIEQFKQDFKESIKQYKTKKISNDIIEAYIDRQITAIRLGEEGDNVYPMNFMFSLNKCYKQDNENYSIINKTEQEWNDIKNRLSDLTYVSYLLDKTLLNENDIAFNFLFIGNNHHNDKLYNSINEKINKINEYANEHTFEEINYIESLNKHYEVCELPILKPNDIEIKNNEKILDHINNFNGVYVYHYNKLNNDIFSTSISFPIPDISKYELQLLMFNAGNFNVANIKGKSIQETQLLFSKFKRISINIQNSYNNKEEIPVLNFTFFSPIESIDSDIKDFFNILFNLEWSNEKLLRKIVEDQIKNEISDFDSESYQYAVDLSKAYFNKYSSIKYYLNGFNKIEDLKKYQNSDNICEIANTVFKKVLSFKPKIVFIGSKKKFDAVNNQVSNIVNKFNFKQNTYFKDYPVIDTNIQHYQLQCNIDTNYYSKIMEVPKYNATIKVISSIISRKMNHQIREVNGAYNATCNYDALKGQLHFFTYRDAKVFDSVQYIDNIFNLIDDSDLSNQNLDVAKIALLTDIYSPKTAVNQCMSEHNYHLQQFNQDDITSYIKDIVNVNAKDIINTIQNIKNSHFSSCIVTKKPLDNKKIIKL